MVDDCLLHIKGLYPSLRPAEQRVADEILENANEVVHLSITALAKRVGVSDATVVKFCKRVGYKGFQDLKIRLAANVAVTPKPIYGEINRGDDIAAIKEKIFRINIQALEDTIRTLDSQALQKAVAAIVKAPRIQFYGIGASGIVAEDAQQKFMRIGLSAAFIDSHMQGRWLLFWTKAMCGGHLLFGSDLGNHGGSKGGQANWSNDHLLDQFPRIASDSLCRPSALHFIVGDHSSQRGHLVSNCPAQCH